jgi:hypothetical protein
MQWNIWREYEYPHNHRNHVVAIVDATTGEEALLMLYTEIHYRPWLAGNLVAEPVNGDWHQRVPMRHGTPEQRQGKYETELE